MAEKLLLCSSLLAAGVIVCGMLGCLVPIIGKLKWRKSPLMGLPSSTRIILLLLAVGLTFVGATKTNRTNGVSSSLGTSSQISRVGSTNALEQANDSVDTARFVDIAVATNGTVSLVAHRPSEAAAVVQDVVVVATTNLCTPTWFALTNTAFAAGETNLAVALARSFLLFNSISNLGIFAFCDAGDSDGDGLADWQEHYNLKTDPNYSDTDFDGIPDGVDDQPLVADYPVSYDGNHLASWVLWNATNGVPAVGVVGEVVYTHSVAIMRTSAWQQYFLSGAADHAAGWKLAGATLEWTDSAGGSGSTSVSPTNDSLRIAFSPSADYATFRVRVTNPAAFTLPSELHILGYAPVVTIGGIVVTNEMGSVSCHVFTNGVASAVPISVDRSHRPCSTVLADEETNIVSLVGTDFRELGGLEIDDSEILYVTDTRSSSEGFLGLPDLGVYPVPGDATPPMSLKRRDILLIRPELSCPTIDNCSGAPTLVWNAETNVYEIVDLYPLDTACLRRNWWRTSEGAWDGDHDPELDVGVETNEFADIAYAVGHRHSCCTGVVSVCGQVVWSASVTHRHVPCGRDFTDPLSDDCGCCSGGCADGDCSALERPEADTKLRFRIPFGQPRRDQVSGFLYFTSEGPTSITPAFFQTKMRGDAALAEFDAGSTHVYSCADERGRSIQLESIADGVRLTVRTQTTDALEHTWEITNVGGSSSCVRFHQISRIGNTLLDWTFAYDADADAWTKTDAISGLRETVTTTGDLDTGIVETTTRTVGDTPLTRTIVTSMRIGTGSTAVLRETRKVEQGWDTVHSTWHMVSERNAAYWNDASSKRHGKLRLLSGTGCAWEYHDFDADGREILRISQRNGAVAPASFPTLGVDGTLQNVTSLGNGFVTVSGYTPIAGDTQAEGDSLNPRVESRYAVTADATTLIGRTWHRYTRPTCNGLAAVKCETWRAGSQSAAFGDADNAYSYNVTLDEDAENVPLVLRGEDVESLDEDGIRTIRAFTNTSDRISITTAKANGLVSFPTYAVEERDATYGNLLRSATYVTAEAAHTNAAVLIDEEVHLYDEKNRLRSTTYLDGTSSTNHYSCCRLLWSRDREGRTVLRSAVTGEDQLYYAEEDVYLREISSGPHHRVTRHYLDALGRETNTTVSVEAMPGAATNRLGAVGQDATVTTTAYPRGTDDLIVLVDARGRTTTTETIHSTNLVTTLEIVSTNGVDVLTNTTIRVRGGATTRRADGDGSWTSTRTETDFLPNGCRRERKFSDSSDLHGTSAEDHVAETSVYDFLGRQVSTTRPGANGGSVVTTNVYEGTSSRQVSSATTGSPSTIFLYNPLGELMTTLRDGQSHTTTTTYEWNASKEIERVERTERRVPTLFSEPVATREVRTQLTGFSADGLLSRRVIVGEDGRETVEERARCNEVGWVFDDLECSTRRTENGTPETSYGKYGIALWDYNLIGYTARGIDSRGREAYRTVSDWLCSDSYVYYQYDAAGDMTAVVYGASQLSNVPPLSTMYARDVLGNEIVRTEQTGSTVLSCVTNAYDSQGRIIGVAGDRHPVRTVFDAEGRKSLSRTTRDSGTTWDETHWERDPVTGFVTAKVYADNSRVAYTYTVDGRPVRTTWARGAWRECVYNDRDLLSGVSYSTNSTPSVFYTYNAAGLPSSVTVAGIGQTVHAYDGRLLCTNETVTSDNGISELIRSYDPFRRPSTTEVVCGTTSASRVTRTYDHENRVSGYTLGDAVHALAVEIGYQGHSVTGIVYTLPNNGVTFNLILNREPGHRDWVTERRYCLNENFGTPVYFHQTTYDSLGRPTATADSLASTRQWSYDRKSQLVGAAITNSAALPYIYAYAYDSIGNRMTATDNSTNTAYMANYLNQYTSILRDSVSSCQPTYDADGNLTQDERYDYAYDCENRLVSVTPHNPMTGDASVENVYDHNSRRIRKIVRHYTGSAWTMFETHTFAWDDWNIVLEEIVSANNATNRIEYFWGNDLSGTEHGAGGVGGLLAVRQDGVFHIPVYDGSGNIVMYVSETGTVSAQYIYDPYGQIVQMSGDYASQFFFGFSTKYHDREVELITYQLRVYNPTHGCWLSRDPIEESGGVNLYGFSANSPPTVIDVLGLLSPETNEFFREPKARFSISKYVEYEATEIQYVNQWYDFLSFIPQQRKELDEYIYTLNFIPRFTSPLCVPEPPYADTGRNALGGFKEMYRVNPKKGDVPQSVWGTGRVVAHEISLAGVLLKMTVEYPDRDVKFGYFVYKADNAYSPFELIGTNENMYERWSIGLERLPKKDKFYTGKRKPCEIIEIQFGDRGCVKPRRVVFKGCFKKGNEK